MLHPHAAAAIKAAKNWKNWGRNMAIAFCKRRGVPSGLLRLARQLEVVS